MKKRYCKVCGKLLTAGERAGKGQLCWKHYVQLKRYGQFKDSNPRTINSPNEFRFVGNDVVEMDTYDILGNVNCTYIFDAEDYPKVSKYKWCTVLHNGVPYARVGKTRLRLHRLIADPKPGALVDHINGDTTNNCKSNLRLASVSLNNINLSVKNGRKNRGVYQKNKGKWYASIQWKNKVYCSPVFETLEEACFARYILEQEIVPEYIIPHNLEEISRLSQEQKDNIIEVLNNKFS